MRYDNLYFNNGEGFMENQQIMLDRESTVNIIDGDNEFVVNSVKKIDIKSVDHGKVKITLGPQISFISSNTRIMINRIKDMVCIEMLQSEERLVQCTDMVKAQEARGIIDYITEYAPDLFSIEALLKKPIEELRKLKESMDDLANCY